MKKAPILLVFLAVMPILSWGQQFYERLPPEKRHELAEAYWLVGRQYIDTGKAAKGRGFQELAFHIDPAMDPAAIRLEDAASAEELIASAQVVYLQEPADDLLRSRFTRLVGAFLLGDTDSVLELLDGTIAVDGAEVTQAQVRDQLERFQADRSLRGLAPSEVYDMGTFAVTADPAGASAKWGPTWRIDVRARKDYSGLIAFWRQDQQFWVHRSGNDLLFMAVGSRPPASWTPREPRRADAATRAGAPAGQTEREVQEAFLTCMELFLAKDNRSAKEYLYPQLRILRLNQTISREEMIATFQGYFDAKDFTGVTVRDVVDERTIYVEPTDRLVADGKGPVYLLSVRSRLDLSERIPFWTRFQEYYFTREGSAWKIFAIF